MRCPYCGTENRDDREKCYHCGKDLSMLRLIANRAKNHHNLALEHAERGRLNEAIVELKNALELDQELAEARLLLGTLYARLERPQDARQQWERVLASSPPCERARSYLDQLPKLEKSLPLVRRVRAALAGGIVLALAGIIAAMAAAWPSRESALLENAWAAFAENRPGESLRVLEQLPRPLPAEEMEQSAQTLEDSIDRLVRFHGERINDSLASGNLLAAFDELRILDGWGLPDGYRKTADQYRHLIRREAAERLQQAAGETFGPESLARVERNARTLEIIQPESELPASTVERFRRKGRERLEELLRETGQRIAEGETMEQLAPRIGRIGELAELLDARRTVDAYAESWMRQQAERRLAAARRLVEQNDLDQAREVLDGMEDLPSEDLGEQYARLRETIDKQRLRARARELEELLNGGNIEEAIASLERIDESEDGTEVLALLKPELRERLERLREESAIDSYYSLMKEGDRFDRAGLDAEEARDALRRIGRAQRHLPAGLKAGARDDLLFFEAIAHHTLGDGEAAHRAIERLRSHAPASPYLQTWLSLMEAKNPV